MEKEQHCLLLSLDVGHGFDLEKAVCSHGFFMMAPNLWFPSSKTLQRPLRLANTTTVMVRIFQQNQPPSQLNNTLTIQVFGRASLEDQDKRLLLAHIARMLRISEEDDEKISGFHRIHSVAKERGFGRVFRAPTLFEDMVKCILLCNCQWPRTLSMARALCELQSELKGDPLGYSDAEAATHLNNGSSVAVDEAVAPPNTPALVKESKRKHGKLPPRNIMMQLVASESMDSETVLDSVVAFHHPQNKQEDSNSNNDAPSIVEEEKSSCRQLSSGTVTVASNRMGAFPSPEEVVMLDENILAKRCSLGYRAKRILALAQSIVEGRLQLGELLQVSGDNYDQVWNLLSGLPGFGPFSCANVLVCMGFYQTIPADTETVRHLKQFHRASGCSIYSVKEDAEKIYGKYAPFQFLAYWSELWECYEKRFGKLSQMPHSDYRLITGNNMKKVAAYY